ncbi:MAG TPA: acyl-CoA dehydrogenase [Alphaproteobacteria bacterium]|nr:acyl-CoA dehydrogenase [Alphaproteobacteria bacterium]
MDFTLTPEQVLLRDGVARFATNGFSNGARHDHWKQFADLGWLGIGAPEDAGGFGGATETLLLMEQLGRGLVVSPFVSQVVLAGTILRAANRRNLIEDIVEGRRRFAVAYEERGARYDPSSVDVRAEPDAGGWKLSGMKVRVLDPSSADSLIVSARAPEGIALFLVPASSANLARTTYPGEDGHDVATLQFDGVVVGADAVIAPPGNALDALEAGVDAATAALCAEALGLCAVMLETTVEYLKVRQQFGVPLSSFQALQHRMAEMYIELELIRSMTYHAAMTVESQADAIGRKRDISAAKAQVAKSGRFIGQQAIQLHGAIGMSEEYKIGHYFKRMTFVERLFGDRDYHVRRYLAC